MTSSPRSPAASGRPRLVLCYPVESRHIAQISAVAPEFEVIDAGQERVAEELLTADLFCGHPKVPVPWNEVVRRGRLRWIQSSAAGLDHCLVPSVVESDIIVTSASAYWLTRLPTIRLHFSPVYCGAYRRFFAHSKSANSFAVLHAICTEPELASLAWAATAGGWPKC